MTLSTEQRWLLAGVGGWEMAECFTSPGRGIDRLMTSMYSASTARRDDRYPAWLEGGFSCGYGRIESHRTVGAVTVVVTKKQLAAFAARLDDDVVRRLRDALAALGTETIRWSDTCFCPDPHCVDNNPGDPLYSDRWHPTDEQYQEHLDFSMRLAASLQRLVLEACALEAPVGQLGLFVTETLGAPQ
ncbi:hypothetical protein [Gordonia otitidis]|uniref:Uncharacterized protein n=1 Tax=Gordonia otitidis (strain DSM 44809 / CCUG 52243 / JCM 12355 / NBRC 100426 / IFM 10032) TaxID=1108044 RepID=H5TSK4_GORO1|nr:hypothetical protein [Gordonia otitidis]GAB36462.1 hypothetical protein GOOTI_221_00050 [Gordonia otitidis NBRC 100426]